MFSSQNFWEFELENAVAADNIACQFVQPAELMQEELRSRRLPSLSVRGLIVVYVWIESGASEDLPTRRSLGQPNWETRPPAQTHSHIPTML